jgi:hypothetical protein
MGWSRFSVLASIARATSGDDVSSRVGTAFRQRNNVIHRESFTRLATVAAPIAIGGFQGTPLGQREISESGVLASLASFGVSLQVPFLDFVGVHRFVPALAWIGAFVVALLTACIESVARAIRGVKLSRRSGYLANRAVFFGWCDDDRGAPSPLTFETPWSQSGCLRVTHAECGRWPDNQALRAALLGDHYGRRLIGRAAGFAWHMRTASLYVETVHRNYLPTPGARLCQPMHARRLALRALAHLATATRHPSIGESHVSIEVRSNLPQPAGTALIQHGAHYTTRYRGAAMRGLI